MNSLYDVTRRTMKTREPRMHQFTLEHRSSGICSSVTSPSGGQVPFCPSALSKYLSGVLGTGTGSTWGFGGGWGGMEAIFQVSGIPWWSLQVVAFHQATRLQGAGVWEEGRLDVQPSLRQRGVAAGGGTNLLGPGEAGLLPLSCGQRGGGGAG